MLFLNLRDNPLPKIERFRMRIVDSKDADPLLAPEQKNALQLLPQFLPLLADEFKRIDVLIFLGRVFGILDSAVGTPAKPLRMLLNIGVVGRALKGNIKGDLYVILTGFVQQP